MRLLQRLSTVVWNITMLYCVCIPRSRGESQIDETLSEPFHKLAEFLRNSNSHIRPPIIVLPGLMSTRLVAWKRKRCRGPDINVQDVVWLNLQKLVETMTYDKSCWLECIKLNLNGTDPSDCKLRPDEGLGAIGELSPGSFYTPAATSVFTNMVKYFASEFGYDVNNIIGFPYDWRLAPSEMERRDSFFTQIKYKLETAVKRHKRPAIVMAHSMGNNLFMYFCEWLKVNTKSHERWLKRHVWAYVGFAAPLLGSPGSLRSVFSGHTLGLSISEMQARDIELTFSSSHLVNPRSSQLADPFANSQYEYGHSLLTLKSASGSSNISFGIKDVENGEIFRLAGNLCKESRLAEKYNSLQELYINDPLKPLTNQFERPAIRHVMMLYGVDFPSDVGYSYSIPEVSPSSQDGPFSPILDEILVEEPCGSCDQATTDDCPVDDNNLATDKDTSNSAKAAFENDISMELIDISVTPEGETVSDFAVEISSDNEQYIEGSEAKGLKHPAIFRQVTSASVETGEPPIQVTENTSLQTTTATDIESDKKVSKAKSQNQRKKCKADIYVVKQGNVRGNKKRFYRKSKHYHTGDFTIPYASLSYAQTWLSYGDDHRESYRPAVVRKTGSPWPSSGSVTAAPAVDINSTIRTKTGETTVIVEVEGVDHQEIIKNTYVLSLVFEQLLPLMSKELWLDDSEKEFGHGDELVPAVNIWGETFGENPLEAIGLGIVTGLQNIFKLFGGTIE